MMQPPTLCSITRSSVDKAIASKVCDVAINSMFDVITKKESRNVASEKIADVAPDSSLSD